MTTAREHPGITPYQSPLLGSDAVRAKLRSSLVEHFHSQSPPNILGYSRWTAPSAPPAQQLQQAKLLVGDPIALAENLKILKQYSRLLSQACAIAQKSPSTESSATPLPGHVQPLSSCPSTFPRNLQWFETLSKPFAGLDEAATNRVEQLVEMHAACFPEPAKSSREQAFRLAKTLPHFDRDLAAYYLASECEREYEPCVAHSIMRLHDPPDLETLRQQLATWRNEGLVHVLSVASMHMPALIDWFPGAPVVPHEDRDEEACSLLLTLQALGTRPREYARIMQDFVDTQDPAAPTAQAIATTLDRLAILMSVKSNAETEPGHDLAAALAYFPRLETLETHDLWCRIKPALEQALPPSILRVDPRSACIRKRVKKQSSASSSSLPVAPGSW